jgi:hypothetical protein
MAHPILPKRKQMTAQKRTPNLSQIDLKFTQKRKAHSADFENRLFSTSKRLVLRLKTGCFDPQKGLFSKSLILKALKPLP